MNKPRDIRIEDYTYPLPQERIAKYPLQQRDSSQLFCYDNGAISKTTFGRLPEMLSPKSLLIYNDTKVIRARLAFFKPTGARIEVFCLDPVLPALYEQALTAHGECIWRCLIGNARKWKQEEPLSISFVHKNENHLLTAIRSHTNHSKGEDIIFRWSSELSFGELLEHLGQLPIPPYLNRETEESDLSTYQTVYAQAEGSVAAPTAGLHFTHDVLSGLAARGVSTAHVTLHVGAGTFRPVKSATIGEHPMHSETLSLRRETLLQLRDHDGPIVAVGTTSLRTLESLYYMGVHVLESRTEPFAVSQWEPYDRSYPYAISEALDALISYLERHNQTTLVGRTEIIIVPGFSFRLVDRLITNFHQPHSTLLLLIAAFIGSQWRQVYDYALAHEGRFLSYGDSSLLTRSAATSSLP